MEREPTLVEHLCGLHIDEYKFRIFRKTAIICTIGPASRNVETLKEMIKRGMNIARLNFSHGTHEYHAETIANLREALRSVGDERTIGIALDTKGPEIRTGVLDAGATAEVELTKDSNVILTTDPKYSDKCTKERIYVDYKNITKVIGSGKRVYIDDGLICIRVMSVDKDSMQCVVENGGMLGSRKGVNLPGSVVDLPAVTEKDIADLQFGIEKGIDMVFASFIRSGAGIREIRKALGEKGKHIKIIGKIENEEGFENADEIIAEADGIMVARGDLGIQIPPEQVFLVQKTLTAKCNRIGKPVICATQMLESMVYKPRSTRAESRRSWRKSDSVILAQHGEGCCGDLVAIKAYLYGAHYGSPSDSISEHSYNNICEDLIEVLGSDVANAVLDGVDCVMLSGETAKGSYPVEALQMMHQLCREAESTIVHSKFFEELLRFIPKPTDMAQTTAIAATSAVESCQAKGIICVTNNGRAARMLSHCRPSVPIYAVTSDAVVARQLHLHRGVFPLHFKGKMSGDVLDDLERQLDLAIGVGKECGYIRSGDLLIVVTGANEDGSDVEVTDFHGLFESVVGSITA